LKKTSKMNLIEGLQKEMNRVREMITEYRSLPKNAGMLSSILMEAIIKDAENAIASGDTIQMIKSLEELKKYEN